MRIFIEEERLTLREEQPWNVKESERKGGVWNRVLWWCDFEVVKNPDRRGFCH